MTFLFNDSIQKTKIVFCIASASVQDEAMRMALDSHLVPLRESGGVLIIHDNAALPGDSHALRIQENIKLADLIVCLLSSDFFASSHCLSLLRQSQDRHAVGKSQVLFVLIRAVYWQGIGIDSSLILPSNHEAIALCGDPDEAWRTIVSSIHSILWKNIYPPHSKHPNKIIDGEPVWQELRAIASKIKDITTSKALDYLLYQPVIDGNRYSPLMMIEPLLPEQCLTNSLAYYRSRLLQVQAKMDSEKRSDDFLEITNIDAQEGVLDVNLRNKSDDSILITRISVLIVRDYGSVLGVLQSSARYVLPISDIDLGEKCNLNVSHVIEPRHADRFLVALETSRVLLIRVTIDYNKFFSISENVWLWTSIDNHPQNVACSTDNSINLG